jgi:hypothetical protein
MAKVSEVAHDKDGNRIEGPTDQIRGNVPEWPSDDLLAANKAFWRLCLAKLQNKDPRDVYEEERSGVKGVVGELTKSRVAMELWPALSKGQLNAFIGSTLRYQYGNMEILVRGRGDVPGMLWVAYEWRYNAQVANDAYSAKYRHAPKKGTGQKDAIDLMEEEKEPVMNQVAGIQVDMAPAGQVGTREGLSVVEMLREAADVYESVGEREKTLREAQRTLLTYLDDMRLVVEGL